MSGDEPNKMAGRRFVPILGMHRSGTSLAARVIAKADFPEGRHVLQEQLPESADGYWEDSQIMSTQETLRCARFGDILQVWGVYAIDFRCPADDLAKAREALSGVLRDRFDGHDVFAFKAGLVI
jgi:hypothetical protein